jgi:hydroxyacylglutathione hydrolase
MRPRVEIVPVGQDNYCYLVVRRDGRGAAIVDPGEAEPVRAALAGLGLAPLEIWITHKHADHLAGAAPLAREYDIPVRGPWELPEMATRVHPLADGGGFLFGAAEVRVWEIGGHTRGHLVYLIDGALFTGDILFLGGCGRLFEGTAEELYRGLRDRIMPLPENTLIYCGHEYAERNLRFALEIEPANPNVQRRFSQVKRLREEGRPSVPGELGVEILTNPFLRVDDPALAKALARRHDDVPRDPAGRFAFIRRLRDFF